MSQNNVEANQTKTIIVNGYATADITSEALARWANNLTYVSFYSYGFNRNGELVPINDAALIQDAYNLDVAPLMVLTPIDESGTYSYDLLRVLFTEPAMRDRLINNITNVVFEKKYYGVVFNFGYIAPGDKEQFIITVSKTSARLNAIGALVIVSIVPGINDEGIDYISLGKAANFVELRTFQWEGIYSPPAAVTSVDLLEEMLALIITRIDSNKILLGLPNYGLDWILPHVPGESTASIISNPEAIELAEQFKVEIQFDVVSRAPFYRYTNGSGRVHEVWFEDIRSLRAKLELVNQFNLAGISIWTIMNPFPAGIQMIDEMFTVYQV